MTKARANRIGGLTEGLLRAAESACRAAIVRGDWSSRQAYRLAVARLAAHMASRGSEA